MSNLVTLTSEDVLRIHDALCADFYGTGDPISPPGVKSQALLESAVGRQDVGAHRSRKYDDPVSNAATLTYGLCNDHPFHNGNKRTSLVAMLAHLDRNRLTLVNTKQEELFEMILAVATKQMAAQAMRRRPKNFRGWKHDHDAEIEALAMWLKPRTKRVKRGERQLTYRELRIVLKRFGFDLRDPHNNLVDVYKLEERRPFLRRTPRPVERKVGTIGYHSEGEVVAIKVMKDIRRISELREEDGCDSEAFYAGAEQFDVFINQYRTILRRLARR